MNLGFKREISGQPTYFRDAVLAAFGLPAVDGGRIHSLKHHTIRLGERWKVGDVIHFCFGIRTKQYEQWHVGECTHVTPVYIKQIDRKFGLFDVVLIHRGPNGEQLDFLPTLEVVRNDGLTIGQFNSWFRQDVGDSGGGLQVAQIVHWTDVRYPRLGE